MANTPTTTGQLRKFLLESLNDVKCGHIPVDRAMAITKMAAQINESVRVELQTNRVMAQTGQDVSIWGELPLGEVVK